MRVSHLNPELIYPEISSYKIVDVRRPEEFTGELGHIENSELITMDQALAGKLEKFDKQQKILFVCRSGARSGRVTEYAMTLGFQDVHNMAGGMVRWNELKYPTRK